MTASRSKTSPDLRALPEALQAEFQDFLVALEGDGGLSGSSRSAYGRDLRSYLAYAAALGARDAGELTPELVRSHVEGLRAAGRAPATVARRISSLRRFHEHLRSVGHCLADPTEGLRPPRVTRRAPDPLTVGEAERLMSAVHGDSPLALRDRAVLEVLYAAGLRVSELIGLRTGDLDPEGGLVRSRGPGGRERTIPLGEAAVRAADRYARRGRPALVVEDTEDTFFLGARGRSLSRVRVWKIVRAAAARAGLDRTVNAQTLRHTFACHLLEGGLGLGDLQLLLGHADISTTLVYGAGGDERLRELHHAYHPRG